MNTQTNLKFALDYDPETTWAALGFGTPWNGWATPIVSREVMEKFMDHVKNDPELTEDLLDGTIGWEGDDAIIDGARISPMEDGSYAFGFLGWTFIEA